MDLRGFFNLRKSGHSADHFSFAYGGPHPYFGVLYAT